MPFDATIADRVRPLMVRRAGAVEKKMFGGVGFLLSGNMLRRRLEGLAHRATGT